MIAVDTNVLVRYVVADDRQQLQSALQTLDTTDRVFISHTVLLEFQWVLSRVYKLEQTAVSRSLRQILGLSNVLVPGIAVVFRAVELYEKGLDFADALHVVAMPAGCTMKTFDRQFQKRGSSEGYDIEVVSIDD